MAFLAPLRNLGQMAGYPHYRVLDSCINNLLNDLSLERCYALANYVI